MYNYSLCVCSFTNLVIVYAKFVKLLSKHVDSTSRLRDVDLTNFEARRRHRSVCIITQPYRGHIVSMSCVLRVSCHINQEIARINQFLVTYTYILVNKKNENFSFF